LNCTADGIENPSMDGHRGGGVDAQVATVGDWPSPARAWYALLVLTVGLMIATVDRGILTLLVAPIRSHLEITDTQFSVLHGWAFVSVYAILGLPIARLADRGSRRLIIGVGMAFWSVMTGLCGFANSFVQFFMARAGVGAGESAYAPAVYSILQDSFPPQKLPRVFSIMAIGFAYGTSFGVILGAALLLLATDLAALPLFSGLEPWQVVLILVAVPGVLLALVMTTVQEPPRRGLLPGSAGKALPLRQVYDYFRDHSRTYVPMFAAMGIKAMLSFGAGLWVPEMFRRTHEWAPAKTALWIGSLGLVVAPLGLMTGSWLAERYARRGFDDANLRVLQIATLLVIPFSVAYPLAATPEWALVFWSLNFFCAMIGVGPANAAVQVITPNQMRGQIRAGYQFVFNVVGFGAGPFLIALFTDYVFGHDAALRFSLATVAIIIGPAAALLTWYGMKPYAACVVRSRAWS
jgi:MFS family permease